MRSLCGALWNAPHRLTQFCQWLGHQHAAEKAFVRTLREQT